MLTGKFFSRKLKFPIFYGKRFMSHTPAIALSLSQQITRMDPLNFRRLKIGSKILASLTAVALLAPGVASARIVLTPEEVHGLISVTNSFEGKLDGVMAGEVVRFKVLSPTKFSYEYVKAGEVFTFDGQIDRAGGRPNGNPTLNFKQPNQDEVRFEWQDSRTIQFEFWKAGKRAGQQRNNPAMAKTTLTVATNPLDGSTSEVVTPQRKAAREAAQTLLSAGIYKTLFGTTITMRADGSFVEAGPRFETKGFFIKNGNNLCFDIVNGNCYTVSSPGANGVYTLTYTAQKMQSKDANSQAGKSTTFTPVK